MVVVGALAVWLATGANRGWTKTSVATMRVDEITGIESPHYEKRFVPGLDFLWGALLGGGILACVSLLFRNQPKPKTDRSLP